MGIPSVINIDMKRAFATIVALILLSGCTLFQSSTYDSNEYAGFIRTLTMFEAAHKSCDDFMNVKPQMLYLTGTVGYELDYLHNYAKYRMIDNESTVDIIATIRETNNELHQRYNEDTIPSKIYCKAKTTVLIEQATMGAEAMQKKVRK